MSLQKLLRLPRRLACQTPRYDVLNKKGKKNLASSARLKLSKIKPLVYSLKHISDSASC